MSPQSIGTIYRVEGLVESRNNPDGTLRFIDSEEVFYFYNESDARRSFEISWHKLTSVEFAPLQSRLGVAAIGTFEGKKHLLGRIIPIDHAQHIHNAPTHL